MKNMIPICLIEYLKSLRNHIQHCGLPVHYLQFHSNKINIDDEVFHKHTNTPSLVLTHLKDDTQFKKSVIEELEGLGERFDLKPLMREYIDCIGRIHLVVRNILSNDLPQWDSLLIETKKRYEDKFSEDSLGLYAIEYNEQGYLQKVSILEDIIERRRKLETRNSLVVKLAKHIITNEVSKKSN